MNPPALMRGWKASHHGVARSRQREPPPHRRRAAARFIPLVVLVAGLVAFFALGLDRYVTFQALCHHRDALVAWVGDNPLLAPVVYVLVYAAMVAFSLPGGALATIVGGFLFGTVAGAGYRRDRRHRSAPRCCSSRRARRSARRCAPAPARR